MTSLLATLGRLTLVIVVVVLVAEETSAIAATRGPLRFWFAANENFSTKKYGYAPAVIKASDGRYHIWYCGNRTSGEFKDSIFYIAIDPARPGVRAEPRAVLDANDVDAAWDSFHVCDPTIVRGRFRFGGRNFPYALFYTGNPKDASEYNQIGVAFSETIDERQSWVRYPFPLLRHPQVPMASALSNKVDVAAIAGPGVWGVGQPSATSVDDAKKLLVYAVGDAAGTRTEVRTVDLSDLDHTPIVSEPWTLRSDGLTELPQLVMRNIDIAYRPTSDTFYAVRDYRTEFNSPQPNFLPHALQIVSIAAKGVWVDKRFGNEQWRQEGVIDVAASGFRRNHNAGFVRNEWGQTADQGEFEVFFSTSCSFEPGDARFCTPAVGGRPEFSYEIWSQKFAF